MGKLRGVSTIAKVLKSTAADRWKQREKIKCHVSSSDCPALAKKRCIIREGQFEKLDKARFTWYMQQHSKGAPVSGPLLQEKALQFFPTIYPDSNAESFKARSGWLYRFSIRHGIQGISLQEEALSADTSAVEPYQAELSKKWRMKGTC